MNLTALQTAVLTRLGVPSTDAFYTSANLTDIINASIQFISGQEDWYWLEATETIACSNGTEAYATAAASQRTIVIYDSTGIPLERRPLDELYRMTAAVAATPRFFGYRAGNIILRPVPNGTFNIQHVYVGTETRLSSGSDTPAMPAQFHDAIADYAAYLGHLRSGDVSRAEPFKQAWLEWKELMEERGDRYAESTGGGEPPEVKAPATK